MTRSLLKFLAAAVVALTPSAAEAMSQSSIPSKFGIPWGNSAGPSYIRVIPQSSQIGITNCAASLTDGFPPLTFVPQSSGGCPPFGADFNGILKQITQWSQWGSAGGPVFYDSAFSTSIGGYPKGAVLQSSVLLGRLWFSIADNNTTNPDSQTSANWVPLPGTAGAGTPMPSFSTVVPQGQVPANGQSVGNASSNASLRANADCYWLFVAMWTNCQTCSLFNSVGSPISKGANANADWNANNAITVPLMTGVDLTGIDNIAGTTTNNLANVPITAGQRTVPMSLLGENLHQLTLTETPTGITSSVIQTINTSGTASVSGTINVSTAGLSFPNLAGTNGSIASFGPNVGGGGASISPAVASGSWSTVTTMSGSNTLSGTASTSGLNTIVVTSTNTSGGAHNTVPRTFLVQWNLAL